MQYTPQIVSLSCSVTAEFPTFHDSHLSWFHHGAEGRKRASRMSCIRMNQRRLKNIIWSSVSGPAYTLARLLQTGIAFYNPIASRTIFIVPRAVSAALRAPFSAASSSSLPLPFMMASSLSRIGAR